MVEKTYTHQLWVRLTDGSWTAYDETGQKIAYVLEDLKDDEDPVAIPFKDYVKKMFQPTKWKLGE